MKATHSLAVILAFAGLAGCGWGEVTLVKVTGTITKNAKPLADADVAFVPVGTNQFATPGADTSGPDGNYMVKYRGRTGVAPGKYKVIVTPPDPNAAANANIPEAFKGDPLMFERSKKLPRVGDAQQSAARPKDVAGGPSEFDAEVEDNVSSKVLDFDIKVSSSTKAAPAKN